MLEVNRFWIVAVRSQTKAVEQTIFRIGGSENDTDGRLVRSSVRILSRTSKPFTFGSFKSSRILFVVYAADTIRVRASAIVIVQRFRSFPNNYCFVDDSIY